MLPGLILIFFYWRLVSIHKTADILVCCAFDVFENSEMVMFCVIEERIES